MARANVTRPPSKFDNLLDASTRKDEEVPWDVEGGWASLQGWASYPLEGLLYTGSVHIQHPRRPDIIAWFQPRSPTFAATSTTMIRVQMIDGLTLRRKNEPSSPFNPCGEDIMGSCRSGRGHNLRNRTPSGVLLCT